MPLAEGAMTDTEQNKPDVHVDERLDCCGLRCPLPLLRTKQALHKMAAGGVLEVMATDAGAQRDIPAFVKLSSHRLLGKVEQDGQFLFWIEKG